MGQKIQKLTEEEWSELNNGSRGTTTSQTSTEWLIDKLDKLDTELLINKLENKFSRRFYELTKNQIIEQAKEMHHKEIMDSMQKGMELQEKENNRIGFRERNGLLPQQETLYTEEQVMKIAEKSHEIYSSGLGVATDVKKQKLIEYIQSLKQPKKD